MFYFAIFSVVIAGTFYVYLPGLGGPMLLDDFPQLSPLMDEVSLDHQGWREFLFSDSGPLMRPVSMATFLFNAALNGWDIFAWKLTNLVIHLANGIILFFLTTQFFSYDQKIISARVWWLSAILAAVWLLHPLHVSTVLYTVQRMAQLSALFVFSGLLCYVIGRKRQLQQGKGHWLIGTCFVLFLPLAALSKENGVLLPVFVLIIELILFRLRGDKKARHYLAIYLLLFLLLPLIGGLYYFSDHMGFSLNYEGRPFTLYERVLTEFRVIWLYIFQLIIPIQRTMGFFHDDFMVSYGWLDPPTTLVSFWGIAMLLFLAWRVKYCMPLVSAGIFFFFAGHSLESTVIPLELVYEHRNYLPSFGLFLALISALSFLNMARQIISVLAIAIFVNLVALTYLRAQTWASETSFYNFAFQVHPQSRRVTATIAEELTRQGHYDDALHILAPIRGNGPLLQSLYIRCLRNKELKSTDINLTTSKLVSPLDDQTMTGILEIARLGLEKICSIPQEHYIRLLDKAEILNAKSPKEKYKLALYNAQYLWELGKKEKAILTLERAYSFKQDSPIPFFLATEWLIEMRDLARANIYFIRAKEIAAPSRFLYDEFIYKISNKLYENSK